MDCVNRNMRAIGTTKDEVHDRTGWRRIVSVAAPHNQVRAARRRRIIIKQDIMASLYHVASTESDVFASRNVG